MPVTKVRAQISGCRCRFCCRSEKCCQTSLVQPLFPWCYSFAFTWSYLYAWRVCLRKTRDMTSDSGCRQIPGRYDIATDALELFIKRGLRTYSIFLSLQKTPLYTPMVSSWELIELSNFRRVHLQLTRLSKCQTLLTILCTKIYIWG